MKIRVHDPVVAAATTGGCTFEPHVGWWTFATDREVGVSLGKILEGARDAIYIPTLQKTGIPVDAGIINEIKAKARVLGLMAESSARGMWVLSETGEAQAEFVWIFWATEIEHPEVLAQFAKEIRHRTNQDAVAWEEQGELKFTPTAAEDAAEEEKQKMKEKENRLWVVPQNDAEAVEIAGILRDAGENIFETLQPWGASWEPLYDGDRLDSAGVGAELQEKIEEFRNANPTGLIYGVELRGGNPWGAVNIDHHFYRLPGGVVDDRRNPNTSIEQVATLLGVELTRYQKLVAANDVAYIPGMKALGATAAEITIVRHADRGAQGITPDQEAAAVGDVAAAEWSEGPHGKRAIIRLSTPSSTAQSDLLFGKAAEQLHIGAKNWIYFGPRHQELNGINFPEQHWAGGSPESGYCGVTLPGEESQEQILAFFRS